MISRYFKPLSLNEKNVEDLFEYCINDNPQIVGSIAFLFQNDKNTFESFDIIKVGKNYNTIRYMLGQLAHCHLENDEFKFKEMILTYKNEVWTKNPEILTKLIYLGIISSNLSPIDDTAKTITFGKYVKPSLSLEDPEFEKWYAEHKQEWEGRYDPSDPF